MQVKKFISFIIVMVVLTVLSLPVSFALSHQEVDSPLDKPDVGLVKESDGWYLTFGYVLVNPDYNDGKPVLFLVDHLKVSSDTSLDLTFGQPEYVNFSANNYFLYHWYLRGFTAKTQQESKFLSFSFLDIETGTLLYSNRITDATNKIGYQMWAIPYTYGGNFFKDGSGCYGYIIDQSEFYNVNISQNSDIYNITPFVNWGVRPPDVPDQIQLKSPLSEPVADKYNSYAVLDDRLIWISYRINGIYTRSASIENISEIYSYNAQINESGTGTYAGQQNGYTENIVIPSQNYSGTISGETEDITLADSSGYGGNYVGSDLGHSDPHYYQGAWYFVNEDLGNISFTGNHSGVISGTSLGNIDFSGVNTGNVHFNSDGSVSLKDVEYYPVSFNHNDIFEYYRLYCMPTDTDNFVFWLAPDRSFVPMSSVNQLLVNMDFFYSEFDLEGNYIRSTFHTVTETDIGLFDAYQTEEPIHAVKLYGIDFFNIDNLPFNLSSVLWQYDFEFKTWRDNMLSKLNDIYNLLANAQNMPEPGSYDQWGNELNEYESNYSNMSPEQVNIVLKNALGNGRYDNAASQIKAWINNFSIGELIAVCVFALALGTVTLTLGKKKSD